MLFLSVDLGGFATPDEPTVFSAESLVALLLQEQFEIVRHTDDDLPHSAWRPCSRRILVRKKSQAGQTLDREEILQAYMARLGEQG
jgi:hypothetical protein